VVEVVITNIGTASVTLHNTETKLRIVSPSALAGREATLGSSPTITPGESKTLTFTFPSQWSDFAPYSNARAVLTLKDTAGNTVAIFDVGIRIVSGG
jgi:hypothetical protein